MADLEKVYSIKFDTKKAQRALTGVDKQLEKIEDQSEKIGKSFEKYIGKKGVAATEKLNKSLQKTNVNVKKIGDAFKGFGQKLNRYVTLPMAAMSVASLKWARDLNAGMAKVATLIPGQTARVKQLKGEIQELSKATGVATSDLTEGAYAAISAWGDSADTMERLKVVTMASQAGYASTEETLNLLASITETYGDNTKKATEHLADMAFVANKLAIKAPFAEMASSMPQVANVAKELNVRQEELFATMAAGAGVTGNVSEVSTQMRSMFVALTKETKIMEKVVRGINKEFGTNYRTVSQAIGNKKIGLIGFLERLKAGTANSKEFQKALGGRVEGLNLALALTGARTEKYNEALTEMLTKTGQTAEAHKEVTEGINKEGYEWEKTKARMVVFAQRLGDKLLPVLSRLFRHLEPLLKKLEEMDDETLENWMKLAGSLMALGPTLRIFGGLASSMGSISASITSIGASKSALKNSLGIVSRLVGGLSVGLAAGSVGALLIKLIEYNKTQKLAQEEKFEEYGLSAKRVARSKVIPLEKKREYLAKLKGMTAEAKEEVTAPSFGGVGGGLIPTAKTSARQRRLSEAESGIRELEQEVQGQDFESWLYRGQGEYATTPSFSVGDINISISGQGLNEKQVGRETGKRVKRELRGLAKELSLESLTSAPSNY